jgi:hypothetical protein
MGLQASKARKLGSFLDAVDGLDGMDVATLLPRARAFGAPN